MKSDALLARIARLSALLATAKGGARIYLQRDIAALEEEYRSCED